MKIILNTLLLVLSVTSFYVNAGCSVTFTLRKSIQFGAVIVQRDTPVGTTIASVSSPGTNSKIGYCTASGGYEYDQMVYLGGSSAGIYQVYSTNIPGVGIQGNWDGYTYSNPANFSNIPPKSTDAWLPDGGSQNFQLIKTGNITSGSLSSGIVAKTYYDATGPSVSGVEINLINSSVTQVACSITTPNLTFPIGNVLASTFGTSVGTVPAAAKNTQNLGLNCDANANINVTLTGTQNPDVSTTSVLALTGQGSAGVAKGVGVQILYNSSPLVLNNRIVLKQSNGGQETFPLTARYYQTKTAVTTGTANSSATLNLTYQ